MLAKADDYSLTSIFVSYLDLKILKRTIIVKLRYISAQNGMHPRSKCRNHRKFKLLATLTNVLAPRWPVLHFDYFDHLSKRFLEKMIPQHERDLAGQKSICRPVSLKSNLLQFTQWLADRLLALPGPFHVVKNTIKIVQSKICTSM